MTEFTFDRIIAKKKKKKELGKKMTLWTAVNKKGNNKNKTWGRDVCHKSTLILENGLGEYVKNEIDISNEKKEINKIKTCRLLNS